MGNEKMRKRIAGTVLLAGLLLCGSCAGPKGSVGFDKEPVILILGAFDDEVKPIWREMKDSRQGSIEGIEYVKGKLRGSRVVVSWTGIGKVNAAATTTLLIEHFRPVAVIVSGIAGGINPVLGVGDVVIGQKCVQHDLGFWSDDGVERKGFENRLSGEMNPAFFTADARLVDIAERAAKEATLRGVKIEGKEKAAKVKRGVIVTGDTFITSPKKKAELLSGLGADAVEMEGAAIAQICHQRGISHIVIRGISDTADEKAVEDVNTFQNIAIENVSAVVCKMAGLMATQARAGQSPIGN